MSRARTRKMADEALAAGTPTAWFERLYREAEGDVTRVPWADLRPNQRLEQWYTENQVQGEDRSACVVGAGLGDDAEALCGLGFRVTAFDLSETAIAWAKRRYPNTAVEYEVADLLEVESRYRKGFDLVFEAYTIQSMPLSLRVSALDAIAQLVAPKGELLVIARHRADGTIPDGPPWPLAEHELAPLDRVLQRLRFDLYAEAGDPATPRFLAAYRRS